MVPYYYHIHKRKVGGLHESVAGEQRPSLIRVANLPGHDLPDPEYRLWSAVLAASAYTIALLWLGWTSYRSVSPWSSLGAIALLRFSWPGIYVTVYQKLLDIYGICAERAFAIITCWQYLASGAINLISRPPMNDGIGVHRVMTLLVAWRFCKCRYRSCSIGTENEPGRGASLQGGMLDLTM